MEMDIEVLATTTYTVHLNNEDLQKVRKWIKEHPDDLYGFDAKEKIVKAIYELDIDGKISLYDKGKCIENDVCTQEVNWSEFEEREPEEILED